MGLKKNRVRTDGGRTLVAYSTLHLGFSYSSSRATAPNTHIIIIIIIINGQKLLGSTRLSS